MTTTRTSGSPILTPEQVFDLLVQPTVDESVAARVATVVHTGASSFRIPIVQADPTAAWVNEGAEIPTSDIDLDEASTNFHKLAGLSIVTNELAADSSPAAAEAIGAGLARDLARKVDIAFFGNVASPAPPGLGALSGTSPIDAGAAITNTDPFVEAIAAAEAVGATVDNFVANPADALVLAKVKKATGSNEPLLGVDATSPSRRVVAGVPLLTSPAVAVGTIWGLAKSRVYLVIREDAEVEADGSPFFTSDRTAIRGKLRVGFVFPHPAAVVEMTIDAG